MVNSFSSQKGRNRDWGIAMLLGSGQVTHMMSHIEEFCRLLGICKSRIILSLWGQTEIVDKCCRTYENLFSTVYPCPNCDAGLAKSCGPFY